MQALTRLLLPIGLLAVMALGWIWQAPPGQTAPAAKDPAATPPEQDRPSALSDLPVGRTPTAGIPSPVGADSVPVPPLAARAQASFQMARRALHERDLYRTYVQLHDARAPGSAYAAQVLATSCTAAWLDAKLPLPGSPSGAMGILNPIPGEEASLHARRLAAQQEIRARCQPLMDDRSRREGRKDDPYAQELGEQGADMTGQQRFERAVRNGDVVTVLGVLRTPKGVEAYFEGQPFGGGSQAVFNRSLVLALLRYGWDPNATSPALGSLGQCAMAGRCGANLEQQLNDDGFPPFSDPAVQDLARRLQAALERGDAEAFLKGNVKASQP